MFVYLLKSSDGSRFKIGKAIDIHQRIAGLGGVLNFQIEESLCIQLKSEQDALCVERILHRTFRAFNLPVDDEVRYGGDTEHFNINCFERVVRFLDENKDLFESDVPAKIPVPIRPIPIAIESKEERRERIKNKRKDNLILQISEITARNEWNLDMMIRLVDDFRDGAIKGGRLTDASVLVLIGHSEERVKDLMHVSLNTLSGSSGPFPACRQSGVIAFVTIMDEYLARYGREEAWLYNGAGDSAPLIAAACQDIARQAEDIRSVVAGIPHVSESEVLELIESSGEFVEDGNDSVVAICSGIRQTVVDYLKDSRLFFRASLEDKNGMEFWRLRFWQTSLERLGLSAVDIDAITKEERVLAQKDFVSHILAVANEIFGEKAHSWLHAPEHWLQGRLPISMLDSEERLIRVWKVLSEYSRE